MSFAPSAHIGDQARASGVEVSNANDYTTEELYHKRQVLNAVITLKLDKAYDTSLKKVFKTSIENNFTKVTPAYGTAHYPGIATKTKAILASYKLIIQSSFPLIGLK